MNGRNMNSNGSGNKPVLITGGAGFIGTNVAHRHLSQGHRVVLFDNLSRAGVVKNLEWLQDTHGNLVQFVEGDVRDPGALRPLVKNASKIFHYAAQVAVTTSLVDPIEDFEINARGTLNLLEAVRAMDTPPPLIFTSTNKVYGDLADVKIAHRGARYEPEESVLRHHGFSEKRSVDFHSPYGCSKGAADQYVLDYVRTFKIPAVIFRMSCIYGVHQFGNEDQGWVAHFLIRALAGQPVTIYGDGKQVRDILFIDDLVDAFLLAQSKMRDISGQAFNIGGGPLNTVSLLELLDLIEEVHGTRPKVKFEDWRAADQLYYVSDTRRFSEATGWKAKTSVRQGVTQLYHWLLENVDSTAVLNGRWTDVVSPLGRKVRNGALKNGALVSTSPRSKRLHQRNGHARKKLLAAS
jgi:CDP-paratose 2-epimerase